MKNENQAIGIEVRVKEIRKEGIINSKIKIFRAQKNGTKEPVVAIDDYYNIKDIFNNIVLDIKHNIVLKCKYDSEGYVNIYTTTNTRDILVGNIYSSYGWNRFPVSPSEKEIENLKLLLVKIKDKVEELKHSYEDKQNGGQTRWLF